MNDPKYPNDRIRTEFLAERRSPLNQGSNRNCKLLSQPERGEVKSPQQTAFYMQPSLALAIARFRLAGLVVGWMGMVGVTVGCRGSTSPESLQSLRPPAPMPTAPSSAEVGSKDAMKRHESRLPQITRPSPQIDHSRSRDPFAPLPPLVSKASGAAMPGSYGQALENPISPIRVSETMSPLPTLPPGPLPSPSAISSRVPSAPVAVAPVRRSPIELVGTVRGIRRRALFRSSAGLRDVAPGQVLDGWTVETIGDGSAVLVRGRIRRTLDLHRETMLRSEPPSPGQQASPGQPGPENSAQRKAQP